MRATVVIAIMVCLTGTMAHGQSPQQQEICEKQAKALVASLSAAIMSAAIKSLPRLHTFKNSARTHYNTKLNNCFVLVETTGQGSNGQHSVSSQLVDALEEHVYATYAWTSRDNNKKHGEVPPTTCELTPTRETTNCSSKNEFDAFVAKYMEDE